MEFRWVERRRKPPSLNVSREGPESRGKWTADAAQRQCLRDDSGGAWRRSLRLVEDERKLDELGHGTTADRRRSKFLVRQRAERRPDERHLRRAHELHRFERGQAVAVHDESQNDLPV